MAVLAECLKLGCKILDAVPLTETPYQATHANLARALDLLAKRTLDPALALAKT